jgi:hypothetical protein
MFRPATKPTNPLTIHRGCPKKLDSHPLRSNNSPLDLQAQHGFRHPDARSPLYPYGTTVTLETFPETGYRFASWDSDVEGTTHPLDVVMNANKTITAHFEILQYALNILSPNGNVIRTPDAPLYDHGTTVTLEAVPNYGYHFTGWSGDIPAGAETTNPMAVVLESTHTLTAHFTLNQYPLTIQAENGSVVAAPDQTLYEHGALCHTDGNTQKVSFYRLEWRCRSSDNPSLAP